MVASVDGVRADSVRHTRCDVVNVIVEARVMDVWPQIGAVDSALRWRRTREARLPRRNEIPAIRGKINVAICRRGRSWKYVLDRACWRGGVERRAIAAVGCLAAVRVRVGRGLRDRIAVGSPGASCENRQRTRPRSAAIG